MSEYYGPIGRRPTPADTICFEAYYPHMFSSLPTPRLSTYNVRSYSALAAGNKLRKKRRHIARNLADVMRYSDVVVVQETRHQAPSFYAKFALEWYVFHNPHSTCASTGFDTPEECGLEKISDYEIDTSTEEDSESDSDDDFFDEGVSKSGLGPSMLSQVRPRAGTDIFVRKSFARNFNLSHAVLREGYVHSVTFEPLPHISTEHPYWLEPFTIVNAYISNRSDAETRDCLNCIRSGVFSGKVFAGGDWNIVTRQYETTGNPSAPGLIKLLDETMSSLSLHEVHHPSMTRLQNGSPPQLSRLDKWFTSLTEAEAKLVSPTIWLPPHRYEPGVRKHSPSDHFPVHLSFSSGDKRCGFRIPRWLAASPRLAELVAEKWDTSRVYKTPCDELEALNGLIVDSARCLLKSQKLSTTTWLDAVAMAISVVRKLKLGTISLARARVECLRNQHLVKVAGTLEGDDLLENLEDFIASGQWKEDTLASTYDKKRSVFSDAVASYAPTPSTREGAHMRVRKAVGRSKSGLSFLVSDTGDRITDSEEMAYMLKRSWEPIWDTKPADEEAIRGYLSSYPKRVTLPIDKEISLQDVVAVVSRPRSSCPGPDGIPFVAYSTMCDIAAPILHRVIRHLMAGGPPKSDFNVCSMFFLPKDGTFLPDHMRPIAASNAANRIVAMVVRKKIEPAIHDILERSQAGYVPFNSIEDNIRYFNEEFYSALYTRYSPGYPGPGLEYKYKKGKRTAYWTAADDGSPPPEIGRRDFHSLFLDFRKAFDSVSRAYLIALLRHIGIPECYVNITWALFFHCTAIPALGSGHSVWLDMLDGLKQGCPLAPLFFILAVDPLLYHLSKVPNTTSKCFADDLAIGFRRWRDVLPVFPLIDAWSEVVGLQVNHKKTKFLTTAPEGERPDLSQLLPVHWQAVTFAPSYVYLGVLFGASVDKIMVFAPALAKFQARVASFMHVKDAFSLPERVRIANTYFVPVFSYLHRFFIAPKYVRDQTVSTLRRWLIKGTETTVERLYAPTHAAGLHVPLRDPHLVNIASVLRRQPAEGVYPLPEIGSYSLLMSDQVTLAAAAYGKIVGAVFGSDSEQSALYGALSHCSQVPMLRLANTLSTRVTRHGSGDPPGSTLARIVNNTMLLPVSLNESLRNHAFNIVHSLLYVGHRLGEDHVSSGEGDCVFCGTPDETMAHIFCHCVVVRGAMRRLLGATSGPQRSLVARISSATADQFLLRARVPDSKLLVGLLVFSRAVWKVRWDCAAGDGPDSRVQSAIVDTFLSYYHHRFSWVVRDRDLERRCFEALLRSLPSDSTNIYTDGSSFGNPGPAGSGVFITDPEGAETTCSYYLGIATNAYAEVHAILMATRVLLSAVDDRPVHIFVDNRQAINVATGRNSGWWCSDVASEIKFNLGIITATRSVYLFWVPGHAKIPGNERADDLARAGARQEERKAPLVGSARYARSICDWGYDGYTEAEGETSASEVDGSCSPLFSTSQALSPSLLSRPVGGSSLSQAARSGLSLGPASPEVATRRSFSPDPGSELISPVSPPALLLDAPSPASHGEEAAAAALSPAGSLSSGTGWVATVPPRPLLSSACSRLAGAHFSVLRFSPPDGGSPAPGSAPEAGGPLLSSDSAPAWASPSHSASAVSVSAGLPLAGPLSFGSGSSGRVETESPRPFSSEAGSRLADARYSVLRLPPPHRE